MTPFDSIAPRSRLFVSPNGDDTHDGAELSPLKTLGHASSIATPGTAIMLKGEFRENVRLAVSGLDDAPIWLLPSGPRHSAIIRPADREQTVIGGFGLDNWYIGPIKIVGGRYGIQFNDHDGTLCRRIAIVGALIQECYSSGDGDGIKMSHTDSGWIVGVTILDVQEELCDILASNDVEVAYCDFNGSRSTAAGVFAKGGSKRVKIHHTLIRNCLADGLTIGGQTGAEFFRSGQSDHEAYECEVSDNYIIGVGENTINFKGATLCKAVRNYLHGRPAVSGSPANVLLMHGGPIGGTPMYSSYNEVTGNILRKNGIIKAATGSTVGNILQTKDENPPDIYTVDEWPTKVGPSVLGMGII